MPILLSDAKAEQYQAKGYVHPFRALSPAEAADTRRRLEEFEGRMGDEAQKFLSFKAHLPCKFLCDIVRHPRILDAVEDVLGSDILCWGSSFFQKQEPETEADFDPVMFDELMRLRREFFARTR